ncbi:aldehyde dehydrogenase family protein [Sedimentitalea sp. HM32M-2]|uniref:aldehyde dehydrogenase family protein n=1 Tax=Sedimentitalea sp. HM32M-2 TaxID=3351566 RepID=UPI00363CBC8B
MSNNTSVSELVAKSRAALPAMYEKTQEEVDEIMRVIGKVVHDNAVLLAEMAVEETRMGNVPDKIAKCKSKSELIYLDLRDKKTVGEIRRDKQRGILEYAEPVGVVGALIPTTNPAVTAMSNAMFAIKGRNTIILSPHRRAYDTIKKTMDLMIEVGKEVGLPENAIQMIKTPSREGTRELMSSVDVVLATGGTSMVHAAYASGKPSYGVGPGNVPVAIHPTAMLVNAVECIIKGKSYDNGLICASEQAVFVQAEQYQQVRDIFISKGSFWVDGADKAKLKDLMWVDGHLNGDIVGQSAERLAEMAGFEVPEGTRILLVPETKIAPDEIFSKEKLSPVLAMYKYDHWQEAIDGCEAILKNGGEGHSAGIHSKDHDSSRAYAMRMPASRILVNQTTATNAGGSRENSLVPTTTMGCGSWGNNATSDNISAEHLINIKRLTFKHAYLRDTSTIFDNTMFGSET